MRKVINISEHDHFCDYAELQRPIEMPRRRRADYPEPTTYDRFITLVLVALFGCAGYAFTWLIAEMFRP